MGRFRNLWHWIIASNPGLTWDQRISRWADITALVGVVVGLVVFVVGWLLDYPAAFGWLALLVGLAVWVFVLNGLLAIGRRAQPSASSLESQIQQLTTERDALREENRRLKSRHGDDDLKQRALGLSEKLYQFLEDQSKIDPQNRPGWTMGNPLSGDPESRKRAHEVTQHNNAMMAQYSQKYSGEVGALLEALEQRGWCDSEERKRLERQIDNPLFTPNGRIRPIAQRLAAIGQRL